MSMSVERTWEQQAWFASTSTMQTTKTWVKRIGPEDEAPAAFAKEAAFRDAAYRLYLPEDPRDQVSRPETALCLSAKGLDILESAKGGVKRMAFSFSDILWIEEGGVLLHGWIAFRDSEKSYHAFFNTSNRALVLPLLWSLRERSLSLEAPSEPELAKTAQSVLELDTRDLALVSICRGALRPDGDPELLYFQESIDGRGPFAAMIFKREVVFCRHLQSLGEEAMLEGRSCSYIPLPSKEFLTLIRRERRDLLSLPLCPEGTNGDFSLSKTGAARDHFLEKLRDRIAVKG